MAELAFETIVRVFIALIMLSLLSIIIQHLLSNVEEKIPDIVKVKEFPAVIDGSNLKKEDVIAYSYACREAFHLHVPTKPVEVCFVLKNVSYDALDIDEDYIVVKRKSINAIISYRAYDDKVIIE